MDWIQENLLKTASGVLCDGEVSFGSVGYHLSLEQSDSSQYCRHSTVQVITYGLKHLTVSHFTDTTLKPKDLEAAFVLFSKWTLRKLLLDQHLQTALNMYSAN